MKTNMYMFDGSQSVDLKKIDTGDTIGYSDKEKAKVKMQANIEKMIDLQDRLYAQDKHSVLIILQAMDAAGKDSAIKHVMQGLNPQGTQVFSFKQPSAEELDHDYLWRIHSRTPERGRIGIFNRSYYEEVLVVKVHNMAPYKNSAHPEDSKDFWNQRYRQIRDFEKYMTENGTTIIKFFLHVSKDEQKQRFLDRINDPSKNWKFSEADVKERQYWDKYQECYQDAIRETSTKYAPWYIIPADKKWASRLLMSEVIVNVIEKLDPRYPKLEESQQRQLAICKEQLLNEDN